MNTKLKLEKSKKGNFCHISLKNDKNHNLQ
jgi:hypothetical protein